MSLISKKMNKNIKKRRISEKQNMSKKFRKLEIYFFGNYVIIVVSSISEL